MAKSYYVDDRSASKLDDAAQRQEIAHTLSIITSEGYRSRSCFWKLRHKVPKSLVSAQADDLLAHLTRNGRSMD